MMCLRSFRQDATPSLVVVKARACITAARIRATLVARDQNVRNDRCDRKRDCAPPAP